MNLQMYHLRGSIRVVTDDDAGSSVEHKKGMMMGIVEGLTLTMKYGEAGKTVVEACHMNSKVAIPEYALPPLKDRTFNNELWAGGVVRMYADTSKLRGVVGVGYDRGWVVGFAVGAMVAFSLTFHDCVDVVAKSPNIKKRFPNGVPLNAIPSTWEEMIEALDIKEEK